MSFTSWLRQLRSTVGAGRTGRNHRRRSCRSAPSRLQFELLEVRTVPAFLTPANYPVGSYPQAVLTSDFNGDGLLDLAVANYYSGNVSVLLGNSNGTFQPAQNAATGGYPNSLAVGDFNADGKVDLATANGSGVSVLLGKGNSTFQAPSNISIGVASSSLAVGDFNADGKLDLGVASNNYVIDNAGYYGSFGHYEGQANVLLGNGHGVFDAPLGTALGLGYFSGATVADFNGDGRDDFATVNSNYGGVSILLAKHGWQRQSAGADCLRCRSILPVGTAPRVRQMVLLA